MVRYQEVPAQNVVLYYVFMEFGNRTCAYLYQVADVLWVVLVRVVPVLVQKFSTGWFFQKKSVQITHMSTRYKGTGVLAYNDPGKGVLGAVQETKWELIVTGSLS